MTMFKMYTPTPISRRNEEEYCGAPDVSPPCAIRRAGSVVGENLYRMRGESSCRVVYYKKDAGEDLSNMRMLGIDPGTATCGWAVIERTSSSVRAVEFGAVTTPSTDPMAMRLSAIFNDLSDLVGRLRPEAATVEKLFFGQNSKSALEVGQARGIVLLVLARAALPFVEITPNEVKLAVTGYGRAQKRQIQMMVQRILGLEELPRPDDAADALAIAMTGAEHLKFRRAHSG